MLKRLHEANFVPNIIKNVFLILATGGAIFEKFNFDMIGIFEHKISKDNYPSLIISLLSYDKFIFEPT